MELYISCSGLEGDTGFARLIDILVEYGIDIFVDNKPFTATHLAPYANELKAAIIPSQYAGMVREQGLYVSEYDRGDQTYEEESLQSRALVLIGNAALTLDATSARQQMGARDDMSLLESLGEDLEQLLRHYTFGFGDPDLWHVGRPAYEWYLEKHNSELLESFLNACKGRLLVEDPSSLGHTDPVAALRNLLYAFEVTQDETYLEPVRHAVMNVFATWPRLGGVPVHKINRDRWVWNEVSAMYGGTSAHLARLIGSETLLEDALKLVDKLCEWCQDEDGLYYHAGRPDEHSPVKWSRGMAWALLGLADALENTPANTDVHRSMCKILGKAFIGLRSVQCETGLWRNVLTNPLSMPETSGTCKFIAVFARAVQKGWLKREEVLPVLDQAWFGVKCMLYQNRLLNWCQGTALTMSELHYLRRPHISYRPYSALWAGLELMRAKK